MTLNNVLVNRIFSYKNIELTQLSDDELFELSQSINRDFESTNDCDLQYQCEVEVAYLQKEFQLRWNRKDIHAQYIANFNSNLLLEEEQYPEFNASSNYEFIKLDEYRQDLLNNKPSYTKRYLSNN